MEIHGEMNIDLEEKISELHDEAKSSTSKVVASKKKTLDKAQFRRHQLIGKLHECSQIIQKPGELLETFMAKCKQLVGNNIDASHDEKSKETIKSPKPPKLLQMKSK